MRTLLLAILTLLVLPVWGMVAGIEPIDTDGNGYREVYCIDHLIWMSIFQDLWDDDFEQIADIDASGTFNTNVNPQGGYYGWYHVGTSYTPFTGTYQGNGYTINNLYSNRPDESYQGLFGVTNGAKILNLGLTSARITGQHYVGALIGSAIGTQVTNCYVAGTVTASGSYVGGLIGQTTHYSPVNSCWVQGMVQSNADYIGGLVGQVNTYSPVSNSYVIAGVSGTTYVGGLIGRNVFSNITNCYASGQVTGRGVFGSSLIGQNVSSVVSGLFWNSDACSISGNGCGNGVGSGQLRNQATFYNANWDFVGETTHGTDDYWRIDPSKNNGYPYLSWQQFDPSSEAPVSQQQPVPAGDQEEVDAPDVGVKIRFTNNHEGTNLIITKYYSNPATNGELPTGVEKLAQGYWTVISSGGNVGSYDITFDASGVYNENNFDKLRLFKRENADYPWQDVVADLGATLTFNPPYVTVHGLNSFSDFAMPGFDDSTLPVELSSFSATVNAIGSLVELNWNTASETGLAGYNIYRGFSDLSSQAVRVNGSLIAAANSSIGKNYSFTDTSVYSGSIYNYWLQSVDLDGTIAMHGPVNVVVVAQQPDDPEITPPAHVLNDYPNPFNTSKSSNYYISYRAQPGQQVSLKVYNLLGQLQDSRIVTAAAEEAYLTWRPQNAPSGVYFYQVKSAKFVKTGKVLLLK